MISRRGRWLCAVASAALAAALGGTRSEAATVAASAAAAATSPQSGTAEETRGGAAAIIPVLRPQEELLLEVRTDKWILTDAFSGYSTARGAYLPIGDLSRLLDLAISVDSDAGRAEGWFLDPKRTFRMDIGGGFVETPAGRKTLNPGDAIAAEGDIYVRADLLGRWLPLDAEVILSKQQVHLTLKETFPFEAKIERDQKREALGFRRNARIEYPREETLYEFMTPPALDVNLRASGGIKAANTAQYDVRASGDLAFMNADLFFGGDKSEPLRSVRFTMRRRDPDGQLLGPLGLTLVEFGDTSTVSQTIGMRSRTGRGIAIGNLPLDSQSVFDKIDLRGELSLGYEVELYRNDVLIGSVNTPVDGRYEFLQVPLEFGLNVLRLVFYGPRGERHEEVRRINAGEGRLGTGEFQFQASAVQQDKFLIPIGDDEGTSLADKGDIRAGANAQFGVSPALTLVGGLSSFTANGNRVNQGLFGVRTGLLGSAVQLDGAVQGSGDWAMQAGLAGRLLGASYVLQHSEYAGDFVDEVRGGGAGGLVRATQLRLDRGFDLGDHVLATNIIAERTQDRSDRSQFNAAVRASTNLSRWVVSNIFNYRAIGSSKAVDGAIEANGALGKWGVRAGLSYEIRPSFDLRDLTLTFDRELKNGMLLRTGITQQLSRDRSTRAVVSLAKRFRVFDVAADAQYDTSNGSLLIGVRIGFSLGRGSGRWGLSAPGLARGGSVLALAFRDSDGDGIRDANEEVLPGIGLRGGAGEVKTDDSGRALLTGLGDGRPAQVTFMTDTLSDPYLSPVKPGIEVVPRPGRTHVAMFPVAAVSEVEGKAFFQSGVSARAVANVQLQLIDKAGKVAATARTEYDGFFLFDGVAPGTYVVRLDPEQAEKLKIRMVAEPKVQTHSDGGLIGDVKVNVVRAGAAAAAADTKATT